MLELKKFAITGGMASGKSTVTNIFKSLGAYTVDSDEIVHKLLSPKTILGKKVIDLFGDDIVKNGQIKRSVLADIVFDNPEKLYLLEKVIHPNVFKEIDAIYKKVSLQRSYPIFLVEISLLFEIGAEGYFDGVIVVTAGEELCKKRIKKKGISVNEYHRRMQRQLTPQAKAKRADYILKNEGTLDHLKQEVTTLFKKLST